MVNSLPDGCTLGLEHYKCDPHKKRKQNEAAVDHIPEERRHPNSNVLRHGFDHEIRSVPNVAIGAHADRPQADSLQPDVLHACHRRPTERETRLCPCSLEKRHVGWSVIEEGGEDTSDPEKSNWRVDSQGRPMLI